MGHLLVLHPDPSQPGHVTSRHLLEAGVSLGHLCAAGGVEGWLVTCV